MPTARRPTIFPGMESRPAGRVVSTTRRSRLRPARASVLALSVLASCVPAVAAAQGPVPDAATLRAMDRVLEERMEANGAPSAALAVVADGRVVHARGFGDADARGRATTPDTPFVIGSATKPITALAVMQLVDAGKVDLDDPVRRYVPELRLADDAADRITVRHVLQHTSGLPSNASGGPVLKGVSDGTAFDAIAELEGADPAAAPGTEMEYVNANYVIAGLVVQRASGELYGRYVERHIFRPLRMTRSFAALAPARRAGLATGHRYVFGLTDATGPTFRPGLLAAGYLMSSARDLGRFVAMLLADGVGASGERIVSARGVRALMAPGAHGTQLGPWADGVDSRYAMGWFVGGPWDEPAVLHPGDTVDSSSLVVLLPRRRTAVVTLVGASQELPVPGNPAAITRLQRNAVDVLLGAPVDTGTSARRFALVVDLVLLLLLAAAATALARAVVDLRRRRAARHPGRALVALPLRFVGVALILAYPPLTGLGWGAMRGWHPDLAAALALIALVLFAAAAVRVAWLARGPQAQTAPPTSEREAARPVVAA